MKLIVETPINRSAEEVWNGFTEKLFLKLSPPFPKLKLNRFDGCKVGDEVHLELDFGIYSSKWTSYIVEQANTESEIYFIDTAEDLPFPLKTWKHQHRIKKVSENSCIIIDDIDYYTSSKVLDAIIYPGMWAQFAYRSPVYRKFFEGENS
jgi:ligand-binding SRPBCC domain-containing protein